MTTACCDAALNARASGRRTPPSKCRSLRTGKRCRQVGGPRGPCLGSSSRPSPRRLRRPSTRRPTWTRCQSRSALRHWRRVSWPSTGACIARRAWITILCSVCSPWASPRASRCSARAASRCSWRRPAILSPRAACASSAASGGSSGSPSRAALTSGICGHRRCWHPRGGRTKSSPSPPSDARRSSYSAKRRAPCASPPRSRAPAAASSRCARTR